MCSVALGLTLAAAMIGGVVARSLSDFLARSTETR